jgi:hypothetical protein
MGQLYWNGSTITRAPGLPPRGNQFLLSDCVGVARPHQSLGWQLVLAKVAAGIDRHSDGMRASPSVQLVAGTRAAIMWQ